MRIVPLLKLVLDSEEMVIFDEWLKIEAIYWHSDLSIQSEYEIYDHCITVPTKEGDNAIFVRYEAFIEFMKKWYKSHDRETVSSADH